MTAFTGTSYQLSGRLNSNNDYCSGRDAYLNGSLEESERATHLACTHRMMREAVRLQYLAPPVRWSSELLGNAGTLPVFSVHFRFSVSPTTPTVLARRLWGLFEGNTMRRAVNLLAVRNISANAVTHARV